MLRSAKLCLLTGGKSKPAVAWIWSVVVLPLRDAEEADMRVVPGQPGKIANSQDGSTSDCGHRHPVQHAILSEN